MRKILDIAIERVTPSPDAILRNQGIPAGKNTNERTEKLAREALSSFVTTAQPQGVLMRVSRHEFQPVYHGLGHNYRVTPLESIYPEAHSLALFAVTVGQTISEEINRLFETGDFAAGSMLDGAASEGTEMAAAEAELCFRHQLEDNEQLPAGYGLMQFSPGYCGWHISAQAKLFELLHPEDIGITLSESFLMRPLKSISGVVIAGPKEIFDFEDNFDFCGECKNRTCIERAKALRKQ